jgi:hypothetical protein
VRVKNINGTSDTACVCGTWLKHWETFSGRTATYCSGSTCVRTDLVGAHVQKADSTDGRWYILPLCNAHNRSVGALEVSESYPLVSANKSETCQRWR